MGITRRACLECGRIWRYPHFLPERLAWRIDRYAIWIHRHTSRHLTAVAHTLRGSQR